jgi:hypothetical protein
MVVAPAEEAEGYILSTYIRHSQPTVIRAQIAHFVDDRYILLCDSDTAKGCVAVPIRAFSQTQCGAECTGQMAVS